MNEWIHTAFEMQTTLSIHTHTHTRTHTLTHTHTHMCFYMYECIYIYISIYTYTYIYTSYIHLYINIYIYTPAPFQTVSSLVILLTHTAIKDATYRRSKSHPTKSSSTCELPMHNLLNSMNQNRLWHTQSHKVNST